MTANTGTTGTIEFNDADLQRILQVMRRQQRPMTLAEMVDLLQQ